MENEGEAEGGRAESAASEASLQSPHNRFVLGYFSQPKLARGMLEAQLPAEFLEQLDLGRLTVERSHYVDEQLAEAESDLLFRIPRSTPTKEDVFVYVLWEHQRQRDSFMAVRMWVYMGMLYRDLLRREGREVGGQQLPYVYPLVLYQGTKGWKRGLNLADLIATDGLPREALKWLPQFEVDLIRLDEESQRIEPDEPFAALGLGLMQAVMFRDVESWLSKNIEVLDSLFEHDRSSIILILHYALLSGSGLTRQQFVDILSQAGNREMKVAYEPGSVAEEIAIEAEEKGREEGRAEARSEIESDLVERLCLKGFDDKEIADLLDLTIDAVRSLKPK